MLRLSVIREVNNQPVWYDVDLYEDAPINLRYQFSAIEQINNPQGSFSQVFRVPLTRTNQFLFGQLDEITLQDTQALTNPINLQERIEAELYKGGTLLLRGYVQIKAAYQTKEIYGEVELAFFAGAVDFKTALGGGRLRDLNFNSLNHDVTWANLGPLNGKPAGIEYGLMDRGRNWSFPDNPCGTPTNRILISEMTPFIKAKLVVDKIVETAGFTYESTYFNTSDFARVFLPLFNGSPSILEDENVPENARVGKTSPESWTANTFTDFSKVQLTDVINQGADPGGNWSNTTDEYTAPFNGLFRLRFTYSFTTSGPFGADSVTIAFQKNGASVHTWSVDFANPNNQVEEYEIQLSQGDDVRVFVTNAAVGGGPSTFTLLGNGETLTGQRTALEVDVISKFGDYTMDVSANMPDLSQFDFMLSLQRMYNLVIVPDTQRPNHLIIEPFSDYAYTGRTLRWDRKIDYSKDVKITPTTDLQRLEYEWSHAPGKDFLSEEIQRSLDRVYGRQKVIATENDFATGTLKIETKFAPYIVSAVPGSALYMHRALTSEGKGVENAPPMLAYQNQLFGSPYGELYFTDEDGNQQVDTGTQFFSMYNRGLNPIVESNDLSFGVERPLFPIAVNPRDTLYIRFWASYVKELYSSDSRIVECHVFFDEDQIGLFDFSNTIEFRGTQYRILELSFDASQSSVAKVKLIRRLADVTLCEDLPTGLSSSDFILFNNSTNATPDRGNQNCCEFYGYVWDLNKGGTPSCRPNIATLTT